MGFSIKSIKALRGVATIASVGTSLDGGSPFSAHVFHHGETRSTRIHFSDELLLSTKCALTRLPL